MSLYYWGLRRQDDIAALLDRAMNSSADARWRTFTSRIRGTYSALADGSRPPHDPADAPAELGVADEARRGISTLHTLSAFLDGRGDSAAATAFAARPSVPLRDLADAGALGIVSVSALETGYRWPELEGYMSQVMRDGVRARDHAAAGLSSFTLARLHFLRGRYRDAARWATEAEVHFEQHDPLGTIIDVRVLEVGIACSSGDFDVAMTALDRLHVCCDDHHQLPLQRVPIRRAEGWALRVRNAAEAGRQLLEDAVSLDEMPGLSVHLAYEAQRAGAPAAALVERLAARCESRLVSAYARHASAKSVGDGSGLIEVAEEMAAIGALRYGVEAATDAATAFLVAGRQDSARRAAARARQLHVPDQGAELPRIDGLDATAIDLTPREAQLIDLARQGLSNAEIADRLVISIRTAETHLYRGMQKLGIKNRHDL